MGYLVINGHWSRVPFSTWNFLEHNQNSFLGSSWDLYGTIKISGFQGSPKKSLNRHSIGLRKVSSFISVFMYSLKAGCPGVIGVQISGGCTLRIFKISNSGYLGSIWSPSTSGMHKTCQKSKNGCSSVWEHYNTTMKQGPLCETLPWPFLPHRF